MIFSKKKRRLVFLYEIFFPTFDLTPDSFLRYSRCRRKSRANLWSAMGRWSVRGSTFCKNNSKISFNQVLYCIPWLRLIFELFLQNVIIYTKYAQIGCLNRKCRALFKVLHNYYLVFLFPAVFLVLSIALLVSSWSWMDARKFRKGKLKNFYDVIDNQWRHKLSKSYFT